MIKIALSYTGHSKLVQTTSPKIEMILLDSEYKQLHVPVQCKDYLNEVIATELDMEPRTIFGFTSEYSGRLLVGETFNIALKFLEGEFPLDYIESLGAMLAAIDSSRNFILSVIQTTEDKDIIVITSDIRWLAKPAYLSFYTLMLRMAMGYKGEALEDYYSTFITLDSSKICNSSDKYIAGASLHPFLIYLANGGEITQEYSDYQKTSQLHNNSGVSSYFQQALKSIVPNVIKEEEVNSL